MPEVTWWMIPMSIAFIVLIGLSWWYFLPAAYDGLVNDLYRPISNSGPIVTVRSFHLAAPFMVFGLLSIFAIMVLILIARPLQLTQRRINELFKPFLWVGIVGLVFGLLAKPLAWGISSYLESADYYQCEEHSRISPFNTTRTYVRDPQLCSQL